MKHYDHNPRNITAKEMSQLPNSFIEYILAMHENAVVSGKNYA
jgi:hypothetical protein